MKTSLFIIVVPATIFVAGCSGAGMNFEREFSAVPTGANKMQIVSALKTEPLITESFDIGGFSIQRMEVADVKSRYSFVLASTPMTEPKLVAKAQFSHINCK